MRKGLHMNWKKPICDCAILRSRSRSHSGEVGTPMLFSRSPSSQNSSVIFAVHCSCRQAAVGVIAREQGADYQPTHYGTDDNQVTCLLVQVKGLERVAEVGELERGSDHEPHVDVL